MLGDLEKFQKLIEEGTAQEAALGNMDAAITCIAYYIGVRGKAKAVGKSPHALLKERVSNVETCLLAFNFGQELSRFWEFLQSPVFDENDKNEIANHRAMFERIGAAAVGLLRLTPQDRGMFLGSEKVIVCALIPRKEPIPAAPLTL